MSSEATTQLMRVKRNRRSNRGKRFQMSWLRDPIFRGWLQPRTDNFKAYCAPCEVVLNSGKSELLKHGNSGKHKNNLRRKKNNIKNEDYLVEPEQEIEESTDMIDKLEKRQFEIVYHSDAGDDTDQSIVHMKVLEKDGLSVDSQSNPILCNTKTKTIRSSTPTTFRSQNYITIPPSGLIQNSKSLQEIGETSTNTCGLDRYGYFSQIVASKLRQMDRPCNIYAERLISEILFYGELGKVTFDMMNKITSIMNDNERSQ